MFVADKIVQDVAEISSTSSMFNWPGSKTWVYSEKSDFGCVWLPPLSIDAILFQCNSPNH